ncbi:hypothetical protein AAFP30_15930 [Gordonia sp. CPCC 205515]|uniref:hypothetical protein n=1 Tax=Gordonia sp. CPCC 205515 TaxID=3140791 RepID=UPI003AF3DBED
MLVAQANPAQIRDLVHALPGLPDVTIQLVVSAIAQTAFADHRHDLESLLDEPLPGRAAAHLRR